MQIVKDKQIWNTLVLAWKAVAEVAVGLINFLGSRMPIVGDILKDSLAVAIHFAADLIVNEIGGAFKKAMPKKVRDFFFPKTTGAFKPGSGFGMDAIPGFFENNQKTKQQQAEERVGAGVNKLTRGAAIGGAAGAALAKHLVDMGKRHAADDPNREGFSDMRRREFKPYGASSLARIGGGGGVGSFGDMFKEARKQTGIQQNLLNTNQNMLNEIRILRGAKHPSGVIEIEV